MNPALEALARFLTEPGDRWVRIKTKGEVTYISTWFSHDGSNCQTSHNADSVERAVGRWYERCVLRKDDEE